MRCECDYNDCIEQNLYLSNFQKINNQINILHLSLLHILGIGEKVDSGDDVNRRPRRAVTRTKVGLQGQGYLVGKWLGSHKLRVKIEFLSLLPYETPNIFLTVRGILR